MDVSMSRSCLRSLFQAWGISEEVIQTFEEKKITSDLLQYISNDRLHELIPSDGDQIRFHLNYDASNVYRSTELGSAEQFNLTDAHKNATTPTTEPELENLLTNEKSLPFLYVDTPDHLISPEVVQGDIISQPASELPGGVDSKSIQSQKLVTTTATTSGATQPVFTPQIVAVCSDIPAVPRNSFQSSKIDLDAILQAHERGKTIEAHYKTFGSLDQTTRDSLAYELIIHELGNNLTGSISSERFDYIATKIVEKFPTENKEVWIVFDNHQRCITGKGKLYVCWYGLRRKWQQLGLIPRGRQGKKRAAEVLDEEVLLEDSPEAVDSRQWLRNSAKPWVTIEKHWKNTFALRRRRILYENVQVIDTLNEFPAFKDKNRGYTLLEIDFDNIYPDNTAKLFVAWPALCDFFMKKIRKHNKAFPDILNPDVKTAFVLSSISQAFPVVTARKQKQTVKNWRPSRSEAQEAFVLHIETIASLDTKLNERRERVLSYGCQMQPVAVLVGPLEKISQSFVVLDDNYKYEVETPLKGLDVLFKSFHSLHADYPPEASQIFQFFQRAVYGIPRNSQYDPYFNGVETLIQEYKNSLK